jgi:hypothetical protein
MREQYLYRSRLPIACCDQERRIATLIARVDVCLLIERGLQLLQVACPGGLEQLRRANHCDLGQAVF